MSIGSIHRFLRAAGMALSRSQHKITSPDPDYEVKKMIKDTRDQLEAGEVFYYADEFNISRLPTLRSIRSPRGRAK